MGGGYWIIVLCALAGLCRADFGLDTSVPSLQTRVSNAIGTGVSPLLITNGTITVDVDADVSGALGSVVEVTNSVGSSVNRMFVATKMAVSDTSTPVGVLFLGLKANVVSATSGIACTLSKAEEFQKTVTNATYKSVVEDLKTLKTQGELLADVFSNIQEGVHAAAKSTIPITSSNVGRHITPAMVVSLTSALGTMSSTVKSLADTFAGVIRDRDAAALQITSVNSSANSASMSLAYQTNTFVYYGNEASSALKQNAKTWLSNIMQTYQQISNNPSTYNGGDISNLTQYLSTLNVSEGKYVDSVTTALENLLNNTMQLLTNQTKTSNDALYDAVRNITLASATSDSQHASSCAQRYSGQLTLLPVQVSRLSACLAPESFTLFNLNPLVVPLMSQLQSDATAIGPPQVRTCSRMDGPCSQRYFAAYANLGTQVSTQLQLIQQVVQTEVLFLQTRVVTCVTATVADIAANIETILRSYYDCLESGM